MRVSFLVLLAGLAGVIPVMAAPTPPPVMANLRVSHSASHELTRAGLPAGEIAVQALAASWRSSVSLAAATRVDWGFSWESFDFDRAGSAAVPDTLQEVSAQLGVSHRWNERWRLSATLRPGLYGDFENVGRDAFNAPLLLLATWQRSKDLAWAFGLRADRFSERAVIPLLGVDWKFAPGWEFSLGVPRAGIAYQATPALRLGLGASVQGGNFHVTRDPRAGSPLPGVRLDDTLLDYHEIRAGLTADWRFREFLTLSLEAGVITDQKFDYFDRSYTLDGGGSGFVTLGLRGRF